MIPNWKRGETGKSAEDEKFKEILQIHQKPKNEFFESSTVLAGPPRGRSAGPWAPWGVGGKNKTTGNPHARYLTRHWADGPANLID